MIVHCPHCRKEVEWQSSNSFRPFCSKMCQLIDLGEWVNEEKGIPCGANQNTEITDIPDIEDIEAMLSEIEQNFFKE